MALAFSSSLKLLFSNEKHTEQCYDFNWSLKEKQRPGVSQLFVWGHSGETMSENFARNQTKFVVLHKYLLWTVDDSSPIVEMEWRTLAVARCLFGLFCDLCVWSVEVRHGGRGRSCAEGENRGADIGMPQAASLLPFLLALMGFGECHRALHVWKGWQDSCVLYSLDRANTR